MKAARVEVGDVFEIRLDEARVAYGQVVGKYLEEAYFFALFGSVFPAGQFLTPEQAADDTVALLGLSVDALIAHGQWTITGNAPVRSDVLLPAYKVAVATPGNIMVVDHTGTRRRPASTREIALLRNRAIVAPIRLEKALRAKHGLEPWLDAYAELVPDALRASSRLFPPG